MAGTVSFNAPLIHEGGVYIESKARSIEAEITALTGKVGSIANTKDWNGPAASAFDDEYLRWKKASDAMKVALEELAAAAHKIATQYADTESANTMHR